MPRVQDDRLTRYRAIALGCVWVLLLGLTGSSVLAATMPVPSRGQMMPYGAMTGPFATLPLEPPVGMEYTVTDSPDGSCRAGGGPSSVLPVRCTYTPDGWVVTGGPLAGGQLARPIQELPPDPPDGSAYLVSDATTDSDCTVGGGATGVYPHWCVYDAASMSYHAQAAVSLQAAHAVGSVGGWTDLPSTRPLTIAPGGLSGTRVEIKSDAGAYVEECIDASGLACQPSNMTLRSGDSYCINAILGTPAAEIPIDCWVNTDGTAANFVRLDRGVFAERQTTGSYPHQTYLVTDCTTSACTAGGGSIRASTRWTGSAWVVDWTSSSSGGTPGGSDTQVQFNDGGAFGGDSGLTFNKTTNVLTATGGFVGSARGPQVIASGTEDITVTCDAGGTSSFVVNAAGWGATETNEDLIQHRWPMAGTFRLLYVRSRLNIPAGETLRWTLRVNSADTALTAPITAGTNTAQNTANSVTVAVGDLITFEVVCSGGTTAPSNSDMTIVFEPS